jgi:hypothetical protein
MKLIYLIVFLVLAQAELPVKKEETVHPKPTHQSGDMGTPFSRISQELLNKERHKLAQAEFPVKKEETVHRNPTHQSGVMGTPHSRMSQELLNKERNKLAQDMRMFNQKTALMKHELDAERKQLYVDEHVVHKQF